MPNLQRSRICGAPFRFASCCTASGIGPVPLFLSCPRRRGPILRSVSIGCGVWVPGLALRASPKTTDMVSLSHLIRMTAAAGDVEENLFQRIASVAREQALRRIVVLDAALLHDDDALAQTLDPDTADWVRGRQHLGTI